MTRLPSLVALCTLSALAPAQQRGDSFDVELARLQQALAERQEAATRVDLLLGEVRRGAAPARQAAVQVLLIAEPNADDALRRAARREKSRTRRIAALAALLRRDASVHGDFAAHSIVVDRDSAVRRATAELLRKNGRGAATTAFLAPGLDHRLPQVRARIARALATLADPSAVALLVEAGNAVAGDGGDGGGAGAGARSPRSHVAFLTQTSYLRDFSPEVA